MFSIVRTDAAEILLHPQRLAITRALTQSELTTKQLAERLSDIPQATLYRHLALLLDAGIISVVAERKVRGTQERTYGLGPKAVLTQEAFRTATPEDHYRYFATYVAGLLDHFGGYVRRPDIDLEADGVGYRDHVLNLTDGELRELLADIRAAIASRLDNAPAPGRVPRLLSTITLPIDHPTGDPK